MKKSNAIAAIVMLFAFAALITSAYEWGYASAQSTRANCQAHPSEAALLIILPPDLDEVRP